MPTHFTAAFISSKIWEKRSICLGFSAKMKFCKLLAVFWNKCRLRYSKFLLKLGWGRDLKSMGGWEGLILGSEQNSMVANVWKTCSASARFQKLSCAIKKASSESCSTSVFIPFWYFGSASEAISKRSNTCAPFFINKIVRGGRTWKTSVFWEALNWVFTFGTIVTERIFCKDNWVLGSKVRKLSTSSSSISTR